MAFTGPYTIDGVVDPAGGNVFQLGGTGSDTFDLSSIGPQYKDFTTFNVIGGTWSVSGGGIRRTADGSEGLIPAATQVVSRSSSQTLSGIGRPVNISLVGGLSGSMPNISSTITS